MVDVEAATKPTRPAPDGRLFNRLWPGWATPIMLEGRKRPLTEADLPATPHFLESATLRKLAEDAWSAEVARAAEAARAEQESGVPSKDAKPNIVRVCRAISYSHWYCGAAMLVVHGLLNAVVRPLLLRYAIQCLPTDVPVARAMGAAAALSTSLFFESYCKVQMARTRGHAALRTSRCCRSLLPSLLLRV